MSNNSSVVALVVMGVIVLIIIILGIREEKTRRDKLLKAIKTLYGKRGNDKSVQSRIEHIEGYHNRHKGISAIDDITWHDLDMNELFKLMNTTYSSAGEEYLYYLLRNPKDSIEAINAMEADVTFFENNETARYSVLMSSALVGKTKSYSIYDYIGDKKSKKASSNILHYFLIFILLVSVAMLFVRTGMGIVMLIASLSISIGTYFWSRGSIIEYMTSFKYALRLYNGLIRLYRNSSLEVYKNRMEPSITGLRSFAKRSRFVYASESSGSVIGTILQYINMVFHFDLIVFNQLVKEFEEHYDDIDNMVSVLGYFETVIAIGSFRASCDSYCKPTFGDVTKANAIYHPFLKEPVKNDYKLDKSMLLTGSNASGKSTFLKTVAMNTILSETINTALADEFFTDFYHVYSSMALADNIYKGESYFIVEIKAIRRILEKKDSEKIFCFVDEVLRGTNTVERIAASTQILKNFATNGIMCMAATHDIELTSLLEDYYDNYHFEEEIIDNDVRFNYKLLEGKSKTRNAIKLLGLIGYDDSIIDNAKLMADSFINTNKWEKI